MKHVIILKGLPASGKSTWARQLIEKEPGKYKRISKDDLRGMLDNNKWSKANEKFILKARDMLILTALEEGYHVLVDDTNLHTKHEQAIRDLVKDRAQVEIKDFTGVSVEECIERDRHRQNYVGEQVIRKMYRDFLAPKSPVIVNDPSLPRAIICDLDGTLALMNGRNPYDAEKCETDLLNEAVATILYRFATDETLSILLVSGRQEKHRPQTERWLATHRIPYNALWMRSTGDQRKDTTIKQEIYEQEIKGRYSVAFVIDDRKQVVDLWRSLGLTCLQVAEGEY